MLGFIKSLKHLRKVYSDYASAYRDSNPEGYESEEVVEVVFQKTLKFKEDLKKSGIKVLPSVANSFCSLIPLLVGNEREEIYVIDFGGACGALYFQIRSFFPKPLDIYWAVVETSAMVGKAKKLENEEISFHDSLESAVRRFPRIDMLHTSATLQAVSQPRALLQEMLSLSAEYVFFNRVGVHKGKGDIYTVHKSKLSWNGPGELPPGFRDKWIKYPYSFMEENYFLSTIQNHYQILAKFEDSSGMYPVWGYSIEGYALLCQLHRGL